MNSEFKITLYILFFLILFFVGFYVNAKPLTWKSDPELQDYINEGLQTGYKVYYKITDNCDREDIYHYSVDVGDQQSLELTDNLYFVPGRNYKFQIASYYILKGILIESPLTNVVGCFKPKPLSGVDRMSFEQDLKKKSITQPKENN